MSFYSLTSYSQIRVNQVPLNSEFENLLCTRFDGFDDFVSCGDNDNLSFGNGTTDSPFTITAWINPSDNARFRIVFKYGATLKEYFFQTAGGTKLMASLYDVNNSASIGRHGSSNIPTNTWSHVAMTYNGSGSNTGINIYLNGSLNNGSTFGSGSYTAMSNTSEALEIGRYSTGGYADGGMDEVAVFDAELSASQISDIYGIGKPSSLSGYTSLVSWWRMGDGSTYPVINDDGGGNNPGTMNNMTAGNFITNVPT